MASKSGEGGTVVRKSRRKRGRLLMMIVAIVVLAGAGGGGWFYWHHRTAKVAFEPLQPIYVVIKPFVVTILDANQVSRFVQVGVDLEVTNKAAEDQVRQVLPAIEDAIRLRILQSKIGEVTSPQGVEQLRKALIAQANDTVESAFDPPPHAKPKAETKLNPKSKPTHLAPPAPPPPVRNVYFTELVVE
jgi:flagellar FliL protein